MDRCHDSRPLWPELPSTERREKLISALRPDEFEVADAIRIAAERHGKPDISDLITQSLGALETVAQAASGYPSPLSTQTLGERQRNIQTLIDRLTRQNTFSIDLVIPSRGIMGHAFCMARLNFFRMLRHCLLELLPKDPDLRPLGHRVDDAVADCIHLRATEEILRTILCRAKAPLLVRERAAYLLLRLWHNASSKRLGDLIPILDAIWCARRNARVSVGTLLGASELMSLLVEGCPARFLDFLTSAEATDDEMAAFREFLFGMSFEDLRRLDQRTGTGEILSVTSLMAVEDDSISTLGLFQAGDEAERFFLFFMKRHLMANHREEMGLEGPKQTAEEYLLGEMLQHQWENLGVAL